MQSIYGIDTTRLSGSQSFFCFLREEANLEKSANLSIATQTKTFAWFVQDEGSTSRSAARA